ncbi:MULTISPECIES: MFS transporter [unclassified Butyrivibrio]|uniref:MFS transporter n=1 Tax=unclassified Butyrivibrio TaxID=2639466 RepID=UPI0003B5397C|nr:MULTISPECIES: MFS transporter [unclassified Butyrivibrio]
MVQERGGMDITVVDNKIQNSDAALGWGERVCFGIGKIPSMIVGTLLATFVMIYMTNVAFLDIAVLSILMAVSKGFDGISDVIAGNIIDNTDTKYGKARVWILRTCIPLSLSLILLFSVPAVLPDIAKYVYFFVMYNLVSTCVFTIAQLAHYALLPLMSQSSVEHGMLSVVGSIFDSVSMLLISVSIVPLLTFFSKDSANPYTQTAFYYLIAIFGVVIVISSLICFCGTKERVTYNYVFHEEKKGMKWSVTLRALLRNKYWVVSIFLTVFSFLLMGCNANVNVYYATYVLKDPAFVGLIMLCMQVPGVLVRFSVPFFIKKIDNFGIYLFGNIILLIGSIGLAIVAPNIVGIAVFLCINGAASGIAASAWMGAVADIIKYTEKKEGILSAGMGNAGLSAANKLGIGLGTVVFGFTMSGAGFDAMNGIAQPTAVLDAISFFFLYFPLIIQAIITVLLVTFFNKKSDIRQP